MTRILRPLSLPADPSVLDLRDELLSLVEPAASAASSGVETSVTPSPPLVEPAASAASSGVEASV
ncbi:hypothetical protein GOOTI_107_00010, partial [Gordonia otitidis NBRC 100426]